MTYVTADADVVTKEVGFYVAKAMDDLYYNALKRPAFKKWILYDYPCKQLNAKETPKKVSLPPGLKIMLSDEVIEEVKRYWNERFSDYRSPDWDENKVVTIIFEP
jgi:hypothetical protein